ncbi:MAG: helicase HerA-like domain-containing protein, partial [Sedimentitalea sp.]
PSSQLGPISTTERAAVMAASDMAGKYDKPLDRRSAYEILRARADTAASQAAQAEEKAEELEPMFREYNAGRRYSGTRVARSTSRKTRKTESFGRAMSDMVLKELKGTTGRRIVRGILGGLFKGR